MVLTGSRVVPEALDLQAGLQLALLIMAQME
jgi:hypothetical protein